MMKLIEGAAIAEAWSSMGAGRIAVRERRDVRLPYAAVPRSRELEMKKRAPCERPAVIGGYPPRDCLKRIDSQKQKR